jgi:hypothetical protein
MKYRNIIAAFFISISLVACESEIERTDRLAREAQQKEDAAKAEVARLEQVRIETEKREREEKVRREAEEEKKRKDKEIYDRYINNSLPTGSTPYFDYYGGNPKCNSYGCSEIVVRTSNSDVLVTIKSHGKVVRHAFIKAAGSYTFSMPNGTYQPFFYYGKGWSPEKEMKNGEIKGGFISKEDFGKDDPQSLSNSVLTYELILQAAGNFSTRPSNPLEAL